MAENVQGQCSQFLEERQMAGETAQEYHVPQERAPESDRRGPNFYRQLYGDETIVRPLGPADECAKKANDPNLPVLDIECFRDAAKKQDEIYAKILDQKTEFVNTEAAKSIDWHLKDAIEQNRAHQPIPISTLSGRTVKALADEQAKVKFDKTLLECEETFNCEIPLSELNERTLTDEQIKQKLHPAELKLWNLLEEKGLQPHLGPDQWGRLGISVYLFPEDKKH